MIRTGDMKKENEMSVIIHLQNSGKLTKNLQDKHFHATIERFFLRGLSHGAAEVADFMMSSQV